MTPMPECLWVQLVNKKHKVSAGWLGHNVCKKNFFNSLWQSIINQTQIGFNTHYNQAPWQQISLPRLFNYACSALTHIHKQTASAHCKSCSAARLAGFINHKHTHPFPKLSSCITPFHFFYIPMPKLQFPASVLHPVSVYQSKRSSTIHLNKWLFLMYVHVMRLHMLQLIEFT